MAADKIFATLHKTLVGNTSVSHIRITLELELKLVEDGQNNVKAKDKVSEKVRQDCEEHQARKEEEHSQAATVWTTRWNFEKFIESF